MHLSFPVLSVLTKALERKLLGFTLVHTFSFSKNRVVFAFWKDSVEFFMQLTFENRTVYFQFFDSFNRPKRNFLYQFRELEGALVSKIQMVKYDRSFFLRFADGSTLLFKLHGPFSNLLHIDNNDEVVEIFRKNFHSDFSININSLSRNLDENLLKEICALNEDEFLVGLSKHLPFLQADIRNVVLESSLISAEPAERFRMIKNLIDNPSCDFFIIKNKTFELLNYQPEKWEFHFHDIIEASDKLARLALPEIKFRLIKQNLLNSIQLKIHSVSKAQTNTIRHLRALKNFETYETTGHLLMANLHSIPEGISEVEIEDLFHSGKRKIRMEKQLSVIENARRYYSKSKAFKAEIPKYELLLENVNNELSKLHRLEENLYQIANLKDINTFAKNNKLFIDDEESIDIPFKQFEKDGYEIWVGKNNKNNDLLTHSYAQKNDLWFHARDVAGSHVLLRAKGGSSFPKPVIEYAASLAAGNSRGKTQNLCPVQYCLRKFVTRPKGAAPGQVVLLKENVILVEPLVQ